MSCGWRAVSSTCMTATCKERWVGGVQAEPVSMLKMAQLTRTEMILQPTIYAENSNDFNVVLGIHSAAGVYCFDFQHLVIKLILSVIVTRHCAKH